MFPWVVSALGAAGIVDTERLQTLWSGYGELFRAVLDDERRVIVKWVRPPAQVAASSPSISHARKLSSYDVELAFYRILAPRCDDTCRVPRLLASRRAVSTAEWVIVLEDLDASGYDRRVDEASSPELETALRWLACFHARFVGEQPDGLWTRGNYWRLDTREDELPAIEDGELRAAAPLIAARLSSARFTTVLHGDAKDANFCFAPDGSRVAAVDFQYTGPGCGIVDVAYLLYGRADEPSDGIDHARLEVYFRELRRALRDRAIDIDALEREWRELYPIARLDFCRFLAGWRPSMWRRDVRGQRFVRGLLPALD